MDAMGLPRLFAEQGRRQRGVRRSGFPGWLCPALRGHRSLPVTEGPCVGCQAALSLLCACWGSGLGGPQHTRDVTCPSCCPLCTPARQQSSVWGPGPCVWPPSFLSRMTASTCTSQSELHSSPSSPASQAWGPQPAPRPHPASPHGLSFCRPPGSQEHLPATQGAAGAGGDQEVQSPEGRGERAWTCGFLGPRGGGVATGRGRGRGEGSWSVPLSPRPKDPGWWPLGLNCLLVPQERLLQANLGEMRCAMPRQPPKQVSGAVLGVPSRLRPRVPACWASRAWWAA